MLEAEPVEGRLTAAAGTRGHGARPAALVQSRSGEPLPVALRLWQPAEKQWMAERAARHYAQADHFGVPANRELERLVARDPNSLADAHRLATAWMGIRHFKRHRFASVSEAISSPSPPVTTTLSVSLGFSLSHAGERSPGRYGDADPRGHQRLAIPTTAELAFVLAGPGRSGGERRPKTSGLTCSPERPDARRGRPRGNEQGLRGLAQRWRQSYLRSVG